MNRISLKLKGLSAAKVLVCASLVWSAACGDDEYEPRYPGNYNGGQNPSTGSGSGSNDNGSDDDDSNGDGSSGGGSNNGGSNGGANPGGGSDNGGIPGGGSNNGGSNGGVPGANDPAAQAWCDVLSILETKCQECHAENADSPAPMPLETYADLHAPAVSNPSKKVYELVGTRIHDPRRPMPEPPRKLTAEELQTLDAWIAAGAPGSPSIDCNAGPGGDGNVGGNPGGNDDDVETPDNGGNQPGNPDPTKEEWPADCEKVYEVRIADRPHTVRAGTETHPQFFVDAPWGDQNVQAVAIRPITDNKKVLHHWILYEASGLVGRMITSWSRGKDGMRTLPPDVGMYMPKGKRSLRFDVHYYNIGSKQDQQDLSGVEICVTTKFRKYTAATNMFAGPATAPPNRVVTNVGTCTVRNKSGSSYLITSSPHMHGLGVHAKFSRIRNGQELVLEDAPFNVDAQTVKPLDRVELKNGDKVRVECTYDNPTNKEVRFGQNSDDEMCFNFALYYPMGNLTCTPNLRELLGL
jgi:hypothetical protein